MKKYSLAVVLLLIAGGAFSANATVISFAGLSQAGIGSTTIASPYSQSGFTFTDLGNGSGAGFSVWDASSPNLPGLSVANTSLFETFAFSTTRLTQTGTTPFSLLSIDVAQYECCEPIGPYSVTFTGTFANSSTVVQTFNLSRNGTTPALQTLVLSGFTNVVKVEFSQGQGAPTGYQFDNVTVSSVPEPGTFSFAGISMAALFALRKRFQRA